MKFLLQRFRTGPRRPSAPHRHHHRQSRVHGGGPRFQILSFSEVLLSAIEE